MFRAPGLSRAARSPIIVRMRHERFRTRFLVPVGASGGWRLALDHLRRCAGTIEEVLLLNVRPEVPFSRIRGVARAARLRDAQRALGEALMLPAMQALDAQGVPYSAEVEFGAAAQTIASYARKRLCDSILVGVEAGRPASLAPRSVAASLLRMATVPVVILMPSARFDRSSAVPVRLRPEALDEEVDERTHLGGHMPRRQVHREDVALGRDVVGQHRA
jgi:nucleotide-binding universal stress UspA family protein